MRSPGSAAPSAAIVASSFRQRREQLGGAPGRKAPQLASSAPKTSAVFVRSGFHSRISRPFGAARENAVGPPRRRQGFQQMRQGFRHRGGNCKSDDRRLKNGRTGSRTTPHGRRILRQFDQTVRAAGAGVVAPSHAAAARSQSPPRRCANAIVGGFGHARVEEITLLRRVSSFPLGKTPHGYRLTANRVRVSRNCAA